MIFLNYVHEFEQKAASSHSNMKKGTISGYELLKIEFNIKVLSAKLQIYSYRYPPNLHEHFLFPSVR